MGHCILSYFIKFLLLYNYYYVNVIINYFYSSYCSHSEVIGYIDGIESPRIVGNKQQYKFFKFHLNNGNGRKIQIVAWNDDIDQILPLIMPNHVNILNFSR